MSIYIKVKRKQRGSHHCMWCNCHFIRGPTYATSFLLLQRCCSLSSCISIIHACELTPKSPSIHYFNPCPWTCHTCMVINAQRLDSVNVHKPVSVTDGSVLYHKIHNKFIFGIAWKFHVGHFKRMYWLIHMSAYHRQVFNVPWGIKWEKNEKKHCETSSAC